MKTKSIFHALGLFVIFLAACSESTTDEGLGIDSASDQAVANPPGNCGGDVSFDVDVSDVPGEEEPGDDVASGDDGFDPATQPNPGIGNPAVSRQARIDAKVNAAIAQFMVEQGYSTFDVSSKIYNSKTKTVIVAGCGGTVVIDNSSTTVSPSTTVNAGE